MLIADLLRHKGSDVVTIGPDDSVAELVSRLAEHHIGGLVVLDHDEIAGIVTERDVVRRLHQDGAATLALPVSAVMTRAVVSCVADEPLDSVASTMTDMRIRHMPVVEHRRLIGIVSIGDVVAARIRTLEQERVQLENYITQG